ncbi:S-layer homology domain-containing protein [Bacillus toyonensis]|uniref:S-layer homology domain-containing protein n=1 Tax=Bacillus toyonensis TaxID=155322 RepID=UPI000BEB3B0A|nr:S-layer homology domain-containing protein [Bacillus toyonensis]PEF78262.1 hypothetical protein CON80_26410 [Bacillus toyonensis]PFY19522.1 hypothetical protein COL44_25690 [Bacillus toyonensis]PHE33392.1 hypothetical protein COF73_07020 [Bacillus toyonensis]
MRKRFYMLFVLLLVFGTLFSNNNVSAANNTTFVDVPPDHWAYNEMMYMYDHQIITGYGNGYFGAGDSVTREHMAAFIYRYLKPADSNNNPYTDLDQTNFKKEILALTNAGIFNGTGNQQFNPKGIVTRAQLATVLVKAFNLKVKADYQFDDMHNHWASEYVKALYSNGLVTGTGDRKFNPDMNVTRDQFSVFLYRAIHMNPNYIPQPIEKGICGRNDSVQRAAARSLTKTDVNKLNVKSESTSDSVSLKWTNTADKYNVYLKDKLVWSGSDANYTHESLKDNTRYTFKVVAFDKDSKAVDMNIVQVMTKENKNKIVARAAAPSANTTVLDNVQVVANISQDKIEQKWYGKIPDDEGTYDIYRNDVKIGETQSPCFIDTAVTPGIPYFYKIVGKTKITDPQKLKDAIDKGIPKENDGNYYNYFEVGNESKIFKLEEEYYFASPLMARSSYMYQFEFLYKTFIPDARISGITTDIPFGKGSSFHGDNRTFSYSSEAYRTKTRVLAQFVDGTSKAELLEKKVGQSILYKPGQNPISDTASNSGISLKTIYSSRDSLVFTVNHEVGIPFKAFGLSPPAINYWYVASLNMDGDHSVTGRHDLAPSHELYLTRPYTDRKMITMVRDESRGLLALAGYDKSFKYYWAGT